MSQKSYFICKMKNKPLHMIEWIQTVTQILVYVVNAEILIKNKQWIGFQKTSHIILKKLDYKLFRTLQSDIYFLPLSLSLVFSLSLSLPLSQKFSWNKTSWLIFHALFFCVTCNLEISGPSICNKIIFLYNVFVYL